METTNRRQWSQVGESRSNPSSLINPKHRKHQRTTRTPMHVEKKARTNGRRALINSLGSHPFAVATHHRDLRKSDGNLRLNPASAARKPQPPHVGLLIKYSAVGLDFTSFTSQTFLPPQPEAAVKRKSDKPNFTCTTRCCVRAINSLQDITQCSSVYHCPPLTLKNTQRKKNELRDLKLIYVIEQD